MYLLQTLEVRRHSSRVMNPFIPKDLGCLIGGPMIMVLKKCYCLTGCYKIRNKCLTGPWGKKNSNQKINLLGLHFATIVKRKASHSKWFGSWQPRTGAC